MKTVAETSWYGGNASLGSASVTSVSSTTGAGSGVSIGVATEEEAWVGRSPGRSRSRRSGRRENKTRPTVSSSSVAVANETDTRRH